MKKYLLNFGEYVDKGLKTTKSNLSNIIFNKKKYYFKISRLFNMVFWIFLNLKFNYEIIFLKKFKNLKIIHVLQRGSILKLLKYEYKSLGVIIRQFKDFSN